MINKEFIKETDKLIKLFKKQKLSIENGNIIFAKAKVDNITAGGLILPDAANTKENYQNGLGRIIAVAKNADPQYQPGLYIYYSHEARQPLAIEGLRTLLDYPGLEKEFLWTVQDNNIVMHREIVEAVK